MPPPIVEVRNLHKSYGQTAALRGVSLEIARGEIFGLLGPNGAGKTTLLSMLALLLEPTSGEIRLLGRPAASAARDLRGHLGIVPQELAIYGELTARENLAFFGGLYGLRGRVLHHRVDEVLEAVGLHDRARQRSERFSGGMKRRLNFGAALVHQPELLLLDEPTTGVDPQSRNHLFEEVRRLNAAGVTILYSSHYMEEVQALCTRVGIIDQGRLIVCDSLPGLLRTLPGQIRVRVATPAPGLPERLALLPCSSCREPAPGTWELECTDLKAILVQVLAALQELQLDLLGLEMEEPNLERVFLHLTGHALRD
jgi:ABC-2 type transport system ATP-binding protein